jgi:hypothetical protein
MVICTAVIERERRDGSGTFLVMELTDSKPEVVKSKTTGRPSIVIRKTSIPIAGSNGWNAEDMKSTFFGMKMEGSIRRVPCDPYTITARDGNSIDINFTWEYVEQEHKPIVVQEKEQEEEEEEEEVAPPAKAPTKAEVLKGASTLGNTKRK